MTYCILLECPNESDYCMTCYDKEVEAKLLLQTNLAQAEKKHDALLYQYEACHRDKAELHRVVEDLTQALEVLLEETQGFEADMNGVILSLAKHAIKQGKAALLTKG